ncbi:hypothetical protein AVEN_272446-1 [Araneus ventricosus]|uniref:Uncharacterized protein n=1 Tax=Araneus ventricosus TaxID=182803 RepID=A0A4Y2P170_ARAVE|nr:hypothetical protein AVEN_272446-1 [Araneus ventricosus]
MEARTVQLKILVRENEEPLGLRKAVTESSHSHIQPRPSSDLAPGSDTDITLSTVQEELVVPVCSGTHFVQFSLQLSFDGVWAVTCCHLGVRCQIKFAEEIK